MVVDRAVHNEAGEPIAWVSGPPLADPPAKPGPVALCRCGQSQNKPFCDGSHRNIGFDPTDRATAADEERTGHDVAPDRAPRVTVAPDGPYYVTGAIPVVLADGTSLAVRPRVALCRCGASGNKPLCDGSHIAVGFRHTP